MARDKLQASGETQVLFRQPTAADWKGTKSLEIYQKMLLASVPPVRDACGLEAAFNIAQFCMAGVTVGDLDVLEEHEDSSSFKAVKRALENVDETQQDQLFRAMTATLIRNDDLREGVKDSLPTALNCWAAIAKYWPQFCFTTRVMHFCSCPEKARFDAEEKHCYVPIEGVQSRTNAGEHCRVWFDGEITSETECPDCKGFQWKRRCVMDRLPFQLMIETVAHTERWNVDIMLADLSFKYLSAYGEDVGEKNGPYVKCKAMMLSNLYEKDKICHFKAATWRSGVNGGGRMKDSQDARLIYDFSAEDARGMNVAIGGILLKQQPPARNT